MNAWTHKLCVELIITKRKRLKAYSWNYILLSLSRYSFAHILWARACAYAYACIYIMYYDEVNKKSQNHMDKEMVLHLSFFLLLQLLPVKLSIFFLLHLLVWRTNEAGQNWSMLECFWSFDVMHTYSLANLILSSGRDSHFTISLCLAFFFLLQFIHNVTDIHISILNTVLNYKISTHSLLICCWTCSCWRLLSASDLLPCDVVIASFLLLLIMLCSFSIHIQSPVQFWFSSI